VGTENLLMTEGVDINVLLHDNCETCNKC